MPFPPTRRKIVPHPYAAVSEPGSTRPSPELQLRWKCLQAGRRPPASCPRISLRLPLTQPRAPAEALVQRHKSFQEAWLPWVERTCRAACCGLGGCSQAQGCELQGLPATAPPASSPSLLLFPSPAGGCGDHGAAAKWSSLFLLFLFVNPGVSCLVPSLTYSSPLHLAGRGSCAGICEDRVLWPWCCPRAVCRRPQAPPPPQAPPLSAPGRGSRGCEASSAPLPRGLRITLGKLRRGLASKFGCFPWKRGPEVGDQVPSLGAEIRLPGPGPGGHLERGGRLARNPCFQPNSQLLCLPPCPLTLAWLLWGRASGNRGLPPDQLRGG